MFVYLRSDEPSLFYHRCTQINTDSKSNNICVYLCSSVVKIIHNLTDIYVFQHHLQQHHIILFAAIELFGLQADLPADKLLQFNQARRLLIKN